MWSVGLLGDIDGRHWLEACTCYSLIVFLLSYERCASFDNLEDLNNMIEQGQTTEVNTIQNDLNFKEKPNTKGR